MALAYCFLRKLLSNLKRSFTAAFVWIWSCLDADYFPSRKSAEKNFKIISFERTLPFLFLHGGCLLIFYCGWSPFDLVVCTILYWVRMFAITAFYHRYFSHRTFKTSRLMQAVFALWGLTAVQKGPLWWAAHHRNHHTFSDQENDLHSPYHGGFWWSQIGWVMTEANMRTDYSRIPDFSAYPELRFLNRFDWLGAVLLGTFLYITGTLSQHFMPQLGTSGFQLIVWGFFVSTTVLFHATSTINSLSHQWGTRRYKTKDHSRNNAFLALLTLGEGWHNNHHQYPGSTRQGFYWWEVDVTYYLLRLMEKAGLVSHLQPVPAKAFEKPILLTPDQPVFLSSATASAAI